ncbi:GAF domain-containing protein [Aeoliella sp. ICT_H6.2]|uniref:GAF domain-containing protein n=1 Tax=Aeoliella straminimaris TaxID=2954799 RepID=A0A9X2F9R9_9BACT|nr:GAF domain-containing protein [Aeoliella straminimaris]MCO6045017.1 GAF domain-containing protein [Aeoliella straminimaris]
MQSGINQQAALPGEILGAVVPKVAEPQVVTRPSAAAGQAVLASRQDKLDQRLTAVLRGLVSGFACDAADFYLLNAASNELVLRSHYHAEEGEPGAARRTLAAARADVTALAGSAIVLEDDVEVAGWPVPVWCGAAICLPVASDETIHGTLWLYSSQPRTFADAELELAEVVAGRLAVEIELNAWRVAGSGGNDPAPTPPPVEVETSSATPAASPTTKARIARPASNPLVDEWELAGWTFDGVTPQAFYDWQTLPDGRTLVATGSIDCADAMADGWLQAARIALRAHAGAASDAGELLTRVNHTLWLASPGGEGLAVSVAMLDVDGTHASLATAGEAGFARWRASSCDWTSANCPALGWSERAVYSPSRVELLVRERLVLTAAGMPIAEKRDAHRLSSRLRHSSPDELRAMPGKRALRLFAEAAHSVGKRPAGLALVRRR